ncbi:MAG: CZB domain-containing protein [Kingella sp. (in: b-proteobacteria)]
MDLKVWLSQRIAGKDVPLTLSAAQQDLHGLALETAIEAHKAWCDKLELTLRGKNPDEYDPAVLGADHLCVLGKWLYGNGRALEHFAEYDALREAHKQFHECAGNILNAHKRGYFAEAISLLRHDLVDLSNNVQFALVSLLDKVHDSKLNK